MLVFPVLGDEGVLLGIFSTKEKAEEFSDRYTNGNVHECDVDAPLDSNPGLTHYYVSWTISGNSTRATVYPTVPTLALPPEKPGTKYVWAKDVGEALAKAIKKET